MLSAVMKMSAPMTPVMQDSVFMHVMLHYHLNHVAIIKPVFQIPCVVTLQILIKTVLRIVKIIARMSTTIKQTAIMTHMVMRATIALLWTMKTRRMLIVTASVMCAIKAFPVVMCGLRNLLLVPWTVVMGKWTCMIS